jgi:hypothetical protein
VSIDKWYDVSIQLNRTNIMLKKICLKCGKEFKVYIAREKTAKYCSKECSKKRIYKKCLICNKDFWIRGQQAREGWGKYCSTECYGISNRKKIINNESLCTKCGELKSISEFYSQLQRDGVNKRISSWCKECTKSDIRDYVEKNRALVNERDRKRWKTKRLTELPKRQQANKERKEKYVAYKGGKCQVCGYQECIGSLEFHHTIPEKKEFQVTENKCSWEKAKAELDKCILLCANCHKELHYKEKQSRWLTLDAV